MPHVSSKKIKKAQYTEIYSRLVEVIGETSEKSQSSFFNEFFTETERLMFAKRLAVIYLLSRGVPQSYIAISLSMSPATIARMSLKKELGYFDSIQKIFKRKHESKFHFLERIVSPGLPSKAGRGRWKFLYQK